MSDDQVVKAIAALEGWIDESDEILDGVGQDDLSSRMKVAVSTLHLCLEHCGAIRHLIAEGEVQRLASCLALLRPAFDALLRGWWVGECMSDEHFDALWESGKDFPGGKKKDHLEGIYRTCGAEEASLLRSHAENMQDIHHDFTHGGRIQAARRFSSSGGIAYAERPFEIVYCCNCAMVYDSLAKDKIAQFLGDGSRREKLHALEAIYVRR